MKTNPFSRLIYVLVIISLLIGCEDDPVSNQEEHFEAIGTIIYDATGAVAASILRGVTTDTLFIDNGVLSDHFSVKFYDEDENIIDPPEEEHTSMSYSIEDTTIIGWWQHPGEEGGFEFHLDGNNIGITTLELYIQHEEHNDYRSGEIPIRVK